jgi:hypothetical protein
LSEGVGEETDHEITMQNYAIKYLDYPGAVHCKKCLACNNVVENRPEQYFAKFAAHIAPSC